MNAKAPNSHNRRASERLGLIRDAFVEDAGKVVYPASIINVSQNGCRLMVDGSLHTESLIWLKVADFPQVLARVVWVRGTVAGCEFTEVLSRADLTALRRHETAETNLVELYLAETEV